MYRQGRNVRVFWAHMHAKTGQENISRPLIHALRNIEHKYVNPSPLPICSPLYRNMEEIKSIFQLFHFLGNPLFFFLLSSQLIYYLKTMTKIPKIINIITAADLLSLHFSDPRKIQQF